MRRASTFRLKGDADMTKQRAAGYSILPPAVLQYRVQIRKMHGQQRNGYFHASGALCTNNYLIQYLSKRIMEACKPCGE